MLKISPKIIVSGFFILVFLWLADVNILVQSSNGIFAKTHVVPSIPLPAFILSSVSIVIVLSLQFYFYINIEKRKNEINKTLARFLVFSEFLGSLFLIVGGLALVIFGHDSSVLGFYSLGVYHSALPLIILSTIGYVVLD